MLLCETEEQKTKAEMLNKAAPWEGNISYSVSFCGKKKEPSFSCLKAGIFSACRSGFIPK